MEFGKAAFIGAVSTIAAIGVVATVSSLTTPVNTGAAATYQRVSFGEAGPLTYDQMARTPEQYKGTNVCLDGKIVQAAEKGLAVFLRIQIDTGKQFALEDDIASNYTRSSYNEPHYLYGDKIEFCGVFTGSEAYEGLFHIPRMVPHVDISVIRQVAR
jgi:hypothetical protein